MMMIDHSTKTVPENALCPQSMPVFLWSCYRERVHSWVDESRTYAEAYRDTKQDYAVGQTWFKARSDSTASLSSFPLNS